MIHRRIILVLTVIFLFSMIAASSQGAGTGYDWRTLTTVEEMCRALPERMRALFGELDLDRPGLEKIRSAYQEESLGSACHALLEYYRNGTSGDWYRREAVPQGTTRDEAADAVCKDRFTFYGRTSVVSRHEDGRLDWAHRGPDDDIEWAWALNRHHHLGILLNAFLSTGLPDYVSMIDEHVRDWVTSSLPVL